MTQPVAPTPEPIQAMRTPAAAGPIMRARLNEAELRPMALGRLSWVTISLTNAWRAGMSKAAADPNTKAST